VEVLLLDLERLGSATVFSRSSFFLALSIMLSFIFLRLFQREREREGRLLSMRFLNYFLLGILDDHFLSLKLQTAAFALPVLERLLYRPRRIPAIRVLILTPTRELAVQYVLHSIAFPVLILHGRVTSY